jgi:hypothetical protein
LSAKITIEEATIGMAQYIGLNLRRSDVDEVKASHGHAPVEAAVASVMCSRFAYCGLADGAPFYLFGMRDGTAVDRRGVVWGLGTDQVMRYAKSFWPASVNFVAFCRGQAERLENHVDVRNRVSIVWLKRLGFRFEEPKPYGVAGLPFMRFWMPGGFLSIKPELEKDYV